MSILFVPILLLALFALEQEIYKRHWDRGLSSQLSFRSRSAVEGEQAVLVEIITNRKRLPLPVLQVNFQLGKGLRVLGTENVTVSDKTNMTELFSLRGWQQVTRELSLECRQRGYYRILSNSLIAGDPFADRTYYTSAAQNTELYVFPRMLGRGRMEVPFSCLMGDIHSRQMLYDDPFAFRGIRDYAPTDPMGQINWKASARTGDLKVNLREYTNGQQVMLLLNMEEPRVHFLQVVLEDSIRYALTMAAMLLEEQIPVGILSNGRDAVTGDPLSIEPGSSQGHLRVISEGLARIDLEQKEEEFGAFLRREVLREGERQDGYGQDRERQERDRQAGGKRNAGISEVLRGGMAHQDVTLVLISSSRRPGTMEAARELAGQQGHLLWICPVTTDMDQEPSGDGDGITMMIEVHHG